MSNNGKEDYKVAPLKGEENESSLMANSLQDSAKINAQEHVDDIDIELEPPQNPTTFSLLQRLKLKRGKNWFARNITSMSKGGIRSSIFTLFSGSVGAGVLSLPKVIFP
jgi:hypothetical protein